MDRHSRLLTPLVVALAAALPLAAQAAPAASASAAETAWHDSAIPRVALSWNGQHLAYINNRGGRAQVELSAWPFRNPHAVDVGAGCRPVDLAWGRRSALLAILARCTSSTGAAGTTQTAIQVIAPGNEGAARIVARFTGKAQHLRWGPYGKHIGFLFTPAGGTTQAVALVKTSGGQPEVVTPSNLDVHAFTWAWHSLRIAYTATPRAGEAGEKLYEQNASAGSAPTVLADTANPRSPVHGMQLAVPRWAPVAQHFGHTLARYVLFIGGQRGARGAIAGHIYSVQATGGPVIDLTPNVQVKPSWFTFADRYTLLATQVFGNEVQVTQYARIGHDLARQGRIWFGVTGQFGNGREPLGMATAGTRPRRIAYASMTDGQPAEVHAGFLTGQAPPRVGPASAQVASAAN